MGHLDFDIVSEFDTPVRSVCIHIRISDFTSLCPLHLSRTLYKSPLFMQNKANFRKAQMNVNSFITKDYRKKDDFAVQKNKPNSNPIKPNLPDDQMNVTIYITKEYENKSNWTLRENKANTKPIQSQTKPIPPPQNLADLAGRR